ncbi:toprim domain-containing protein [Candidatus Tisiphia endosymbiont of Sialis lutaria]|uniref:toprim domain-containing protein n=1 Tax=Candidatus Tisiphia endosymbiont of Sialis lutaria TaxID=2029164 RepID=UPI00312CB294
MLTASLPNEYEQSFLDQLDLLQKDGKLNIENLAAIVKTDELRGLIYEYYRYVNNANNNAKLAESTKSADIQGENQQEITSSLPIKIDKTETNENKTNKYNRVNATRKNRLDFNEVKQSLTEYNYRNIFESYARRINGDNVRFKKTSSEISLGSLTMNLRTGLWIRHSTGEGGNIFSFVQKALYCSKLEALERVALTAGISAKENNYYNYHNDNERNNNKQPQESKGHEEVIKKSINEWYAQPYVPDYKPIYHIDKIKDEQRTILIVEGEKTCDKAQELLPDYIVLSWLGGSNGASKANWQQLTGREIVIWADNDQAGITAAKTIGQMINEANGRIGNVTIIDPSRLEFNGTINENILPEKWDLADRLPAGLNIDNLKEAIRNGQQQNISLHNSQSIAAGLQQLLPQSQELAIGERILWQARSVGTLLTREQIIQEATTEFNWQKKLTSSEAKYYMKYAETTGKDGSKHEFLGLQDGIYRDTLVAIAKNGKIKDKESLKLPELIHELQSEYEQKHRISQVSSHHSFGDDEHYQSHIKSLESYGSDRIELYHIMVRDVSLLHQEQLSGLRGRIIKSQQKVIEQKIYEQIKTYQVKQARGQTSNKLDYDDKVKIASKIYDNLCSSKLWQSLAVQDITYMQKLQQEVQQEVQRTKKQEFNDLPQPTPIKPIKIKNNSYEERIEKIVEKYKGQNHDSELINKWTEELAELKTYNAGSLSNIIKIGERKGLEQALKEIVSINADKNKELRVLFEVYKDRIDEIQKFNDKLTIEELKHTIKPLKYNDMVKVVEKMRVDSFRDWIIPQFNKIEKERQETQEVNGLLNSLEQDRELSLKIAKEYQSLTYNVSEEMKGESINDKSRVYDSQPDLLDNIKRDSLYIAKYNIWEKELLIKELKRNTSELKGRVAPLMFKFSQLHRKKQVAQDIKVIEEQGVLIKDNKQFKTVQGYLDDLMNNKEIRPYIRGTDLDGMRVYQKDCVSMISELVHL